MQRDSLVLRGKLIDFDKVLFGLFLVVIERNTEQYSFHVNAAMGRSQFISIFDSSNTPIEDFDKEMTDLLSRGEADIKSSRRLANIVTKNKNIIVKLLEQEDMQSTLHMALSSRLNLFFEAKFQLSIQSHSISEPYEYRDIISEVALRFSYEETQMFRKQFGLPNDVDIIKMEPYLSVNGKYTMSLQKGDLVYCTPSKGMVENKILIEHYELMDNEEEFKKLLGTIEVIRPATDTIIFIVHTSASLYGILEVPNNVLIEVPVADQYDDEEELLIVDDPSMSESAHFSLKEFAKKLSMDPIYTIIIIFGIVIFIILVYGYL